MEKSALCGTSIIDVRNFDCKNTKAIHRIISYPFCSGFIPVRDEQDWNPRRMVDNNQRKSTIQKIDLMDGNYDGVGIRWIHPGFTLGLVTL